MMKDSPAIDIEKARRKANPEATRCIGCQSKKERMDRSLG